jgi:hypothetical protein
MMICALYEMRLRSGISMAAVLAGVSWLLLTPAFLSAAPRVHSSTEVLEHYCSWHDGRLFFTASTGQRWELITSTSDPEISNPGDGRFHPLPRSEVVAALYAIQFPLTRINVDVYILPYPRRGHLESAAGHGAIYLSPGTREFAVSSIHALVAHEIGHQVHRVFLPDNDREGWETYARLRGFFGNPRYTSDAPHAYRPHEVFAEDFRALFGSDLARNGQSLENPELSWPTGVAGLADFMTRLPKSGGETAAMAAYPNPFYSRVLVEVDLAKAGIGTPLPAVVLSGDNAGALSGSASLPNLWRVSIYDARGRLLRTVPLRLDASGKASFEWDGRDSRSNRVPRGAFFARLMYGRGGAQPVAVVKLVLTR